MIQKITPEEAKSIIDSVMPHYLIDVREQDEYDVKHIPRSKLVPLSALEAVCGDRIPNKEIPVLVYCRSGRRSAKAAEILDKLGYKDVRDFGGINDWLYEIELGVINHYA